MIRDSFSRDDEAPLVRLPCYEPPYPLDLDRETMLRHLLIVGGTGSGKTSILNEVMAQLLAARVNNRPIGLLIFDGKEDDSIARVQHLAADAGRTVQVLKPGGNLRYDLLGSLRTLDDVGETARRILMGTGPLGTDNKFWSEMRLTMVDAALSFLVVHGVPIHFETAVDFMRRWFFTANPDAEAVSKIIAHTLRVVTEGGRLPAGIKRKLHQTLDTASLWRTLESRTRTNVQSTLLAAMRPLMDNRSGLMFESGGHPCFRAESVVDDGAVVVVSANAISEPGLARLLFRLAKDDFYRAVQKRRTASGPLCFIVMDEFPLAASPADLENLQTLRSKGAGAVCATQGFIGLDEVLGVRTRQALVASFQNIIAMQSHEIEIDAQLFGMMGEREDGAPPVKSSWDNLIDWSPKPARRRMVPVCPLGALSRLKPFEAYVSFANGIHPTRAVWIQPRFVAVEQTDTPRVISEFTDPLAEVVASIRAGVAPPVSTPIFELMRRLGGKLLMSPVMWQAAVDLCRPEIPKELLIEQVTSFFRVRSGLCPRGIDTLPACWLRALPQLLERRAKKHWHGKIPFGISSLAEQQGALVLGFAQEGECMRREREVTGWDVLRVHLNCQLYPSLWRPLLRRHWRTLHATRPELRPHLKVHASIAGVPTNQYL